MFIDTYLFDGTLGVCVYSLHIMGNLHKMTEEVATQYSNYNKFHMIK
jgi:hypothetical protein